MTGIDKTWKLSTGSPALDGLLAALLLVATMAVLISTSIEGGRDKQSASVRRRVATRIEPPEKVPNVEPIVLRAMTPAEARAFNGAIPFSTERNFSARPFRFTGAPEDRSRATACLAAAVLYEAGDDALGQRAVAQVVLNRVRHPAFPRTVCGVVFQGSERQTGCQFTFTCDGALNRTFSDDAWVRARTIADAAMSGAVFKPVGEATHYHTDWVVPYWSSSLDKIVAVHTHLFFRWTGWWGTPPAFRFAATGVEPRIPQLAKRFPEHAVADPNAPLVALESAEGLSPAAALEGMAKPNAGDPNSFSLLLSPHYANSFPEIAAFACGSRPFCRVRVWTDRARMPKEGAAKLTPPQMAAMSFVYLRIRADSPEKALWNCDQFDRADGRCLWPKAPVPHAAPSTTPSALPAASVQPLAGVRFKQAPGKEPAPVGKAPGE